MRQISSSEWSFVNNKIWARPLNHNDEENSDSTVTVSAFLEIRNAKVALKVSKKIYFLN